MKDVKWAWSFFDEKSDFTGSRLFPWVKEYVLNISKIECSQFRIKKFLLEGEKKFKKISTLDFVLQKYVRLWKVLIGIFPSSITTLFLKSVLAYTFFTHEENRNLLFSNFQKFQHTTIQHKLNFYFCHLKIEMWSPRE